MAFDPAVNLDLDALIRDPQALAAARQRAEEARDDHALLALHSLEVAAEQLPPIIDGARRGRLLCADALSTTWEAWDIRHGGRLLLRCVRPHWRTDAVMLRRMAAAQQSPEPPVWVPDGAWPHLRVAAPGALVADRLPVDDPPSTLFLAQVLGAGLTTLGRLHQAGLVHGGPMLAHLVEGRRGASLLWLDRFQPEGGPRRDLVELAKAVSALDPWQEDPVGELARDWIEAPPLTAADGARLLRRLLATQLLGARHQVELGARQVRRRAHRSRLAALTRQLWTSRPPPVGCWCMRADRHGVLVLVESDGYTLRGGAAADLSARFLPVIYEPGRGLDAQAARAVLRAWALRDDGDRDHRLELQIELGTCEEDAALVARWLSAASRLRVLTRLLDGA